MPAEWLISPWRTFKAADKTISAPLAAATCYPGLISGAKVACTAYGSRTKNLMDFTCRSRARVADSLRGTAIRVEVQIAFQPRTFSAGVARRVAEGRGGPTSVLCTVYLNWSGTGGEEKERQREREREGYGFIRV